MASESEDGCPSGLGQAMRLAAQAAKSGGDPSNIAIKAATIKQLTAFWQCSALGLAFQQ